MALTAVHHIALLVSDYQKSKEFYVDKLGFHIVRENFREDRGDYKLSGWMNFQGGSLPFLKIRTDCRWSCMNNLKESGGHIMTKKHMEDSRTENTYLIMPKHINCYGRLFGGILMQWIDEVAGIVAHRHAGSIVGKTSMEVRIDTYAEDPDGMRRMINRAYEVLVSIDEEGNKLEVPGLFVETEAQKAEWEGGEKRYLLRKQRRKEGY